MTPPDRSPRESAAQRIAAVRARFVEGLPERLTALSKLAFLAAGEDAAAASAAGDSLRLGLHNLSGGAPTLGHAELGRRAALLEARFIAARRADGGFDENAARELASDILKLAETVK